MSGGLDKAEGAEQAAGKSQPMPGSLKCAIATVIIGLVYMVAVFLLGLFALLLVLPTYAGLLVGFLAALIGAATCRRHPVNWRWRYLVVMAVILAQILFLLPGLGTIRLLNLRCRTRVAMTGGQGQLQSWAQSILSEYSGTQESESKGQDAFMREDIPPSEWSDQVRRLKPKRVWVDSTFNGDKPAVRLFYGGGFMHWGIVVVSPGTVPEATHSDTLWIRWSDGVYCWFPD